jgi:hypothetical protein
MHNHTNYQGTPLQFATQLARACLHRGDTALRLHSATTAAIFYDAALAILETTRGRSAPALVGPLLRLAHTLERLEDKEVSRGLLKRVRTILRSCRAIEDFDTQNKALLSLPMAAAGRRQPA